jgi:hypothetical protein
VLLAAQKRPARPAFPSSPAPQLTDIMSSPPKQDDDGVAQSPHSNEDNPVEDDKSPKGDGPMDPEGIDIEVKEQDRWLPIANGTSLSPWPSL